MVLRFRGLDLYIIILECMVLRLRGSECLVLRFRGLECIVTSIEM